jgi:hypothetical protein
MKSLYHAYQAYEAKVERGEFSVRASSKSSGGRIHLELILVQLGELLIRAGLKLKRRYTTGKTMAWSPMTGSKQ